MVSEYQMNQRTLNLWHVFFFRSICERQVNFMYDRDVTKLKNDIKQQSGRFAIFIRILVVL